MGIRTLKRAVFFDRDGVINDAIVRDGNPYPPASLAELRIDAHAPAAVRLLHERGFAAVVVTNQPDVARGTQQRGVVEAINSEIQRKTGVDAVYTCYHDDSDGCECRKPKAGLVLQACRELGLDPARSYMVGDRVKDVLAGRGAGCTTVFIDRGYAESAVGVPAGLVARSLEDAVEQILARERTAA